MTPVEYDLFADAYDAFVRSQSVVHKLAVPAIVELCPTRGRVLDLACGQGVLARALAAAGSKVVGTDISAALLELARREEDRDPQGIRYVEDDARILQHFVDAEFDGVASSLALGNFDDLGAVMSSVVRVLKPDGWFVFATIHPCFSPPYARWSDVDGVVGRVVGHYFNEGQWSSINPRQGPHGRRSWHHRTLSTILNTMMDAGMTIDRVAEPAPEQATIAPVLVVRSRRALVGPRGARSARRAAGSGT